MKILENIRVLLFYLVGHVPFCVTNVKVNSNVSISRSRYINQSFFPSPSKWKVPEKPFFAPFLVFSRVDIFLAHFNLNFLGCSVFLSRFSEISSGWIIFFSSRKLRILRYLFIFGGEFWLFLLGKIIFFFGLDFDVFFSGIIFSFREVFKIFSRAVLNLLRQKIEHFLVRNFFSCGIKKTLTSIERRCLSWEVGDHLTGLSQAL